MGVLRVLLLFCREILIKSYHNSCFTKFIEFEWVGVFPDFLKFREEVMFYTVIFPYRVRQKEKFGLVTHAKHRCVTKALGSCFRASLYCSIPHTSTTNFGKKDCFVQ